MNIKRLRDAAVSPVVGVLLMLVITIIIAAVVSGFAGGLIENKAKTPQASLDITINGAKMGTNDGMNITIRHLSGDPINTLQTELITSWTDQNNDIHYARTVPYDATTTHNTNSLHQPYLVKYDGSGPTISSGNIADLSWGKYIMKAGDVARVDSDISGYAPGSVIKDFDKLTRNDIVTVRLIDIVSGGLIYEKDISPVFNVDG